MRHAPLLLVGLAACAPSGDVDRPVPGFAHPTTDLAPVFGPTWSETHAVTAAPMPMTLTGPPVVFKNVPTSLTVSGGPSGVGGVGLMVSPMTGSPICPTAIAPTCFDLTDPLFLLQITRPAPDGSATFEFTVPSSIPYDGGAFQIGGYDGATYYLSNSVAFDLVETCTAPFDVASADGPGVLVDTGRIDVAWLQPIAPYQTFSLTDTEGAPIPFELDDPSPELDQALTFDLRGLPIGPITLGVTDPCGTTHETVFSYEPDVCDPPITPEALSFVDREADLVLTLDGLAASYLDVTLVELPAGTPVPGTGAVEPTGYGFDPDAPLQRGGDYELRTVDACGGTTTIPVTVLDDCAAPIATSPVSGAVDVPTDTDVVIDFDQPISDLLSYALTSPGSGWTLAIDTSDPFQAVLDPAADALDPSTTYQVTVDTPCGTTHAFSFTTAEPLACTYVSSPESGAGGWAVDDPITVTFDEPIADQVEAELRDATSGVTAPSSTLVVADTVVEIVPTSSLVADTLYELELTLPCGPSTFGFETGGVDAVGGANLVDQAWYLDFSSATVTTPAALESEILPTLQSTLDDRVILGVDAWDGLSQDLVLKTTASQAGTTPITQDLCVPTSGPVPVDFSGDPGFALEFTGLSSDFDTTTFSGNVSPDGAALQDVRLTTYTTVASLEAQSGVPAFFICLGVACAPCPTLPGDCVFIQVDDIVGVDLGAPAVDRTETDILADTATCPNGVQSFP